MTIILSFIQKLKILIEYLIFNSFSERKYFNSRKSKIKVVVDVGSNLGSYIKFLLKTFNDVKIYSIEPNIELLNKQKKMFKNYSNISYHQCAITNLTGKMNFYLRNINSHSSLDEIHPESEINNLVNIIQVNTLTLEDFMKINKIEKIDLLKVDTEGNEVKILESMSNLLKNGKITYLKIEISNNNLIEIFNFLKDFKFEIIGISNLYHKFNKLRLFDLFIKFT